MECSALRLALKHGGIDWESNVLSAFHRLQRTPAPSSPELHEAWAAVHRQFHEALIAGCASPWMLRLCRLLYDQSERYRNLAEQYTTEKNRDAAKEHRELMEAAMARTASNGALNMNVAVNYGGRWDIARAARLAAEAAARGEFAIGDIDEQRLHGYTCLADQPPLDLFIRTGGERRVSNFLLWQIAYAELYFTDTLWPDVDQACLAEALDDYARRERRFGRTGEQVAG